MEQENKEISTEAEGQKQDCSPTVKQKTKSDEGFSLQTMIFGSLIIILVGVIFFLWMNQSSSAFKKVDLVLIIQTLKDEAKAQALKEGVSEEQQGAILEHLKKQMNGIDEIVQKEAKACRCTVLVSSAVIADGSDSITDITDDVMAKVRSIK